MSAGPFPDPAVGETVIAADDLRIGDYAWFDRGRPALIIIRKINPNELDSFSGEVYRVGAGETPDKRTFTLVRRAK